MLRTAAAVLLVGAVDVFPAGAQPIVPPPEAAFSTSTARVATTLSAAPVRPLRSGERERIEERWGIRIESMRLTAGGYMLDFRFRVLDPAKAAPLFERKVHPVLTDERTGAVMSVPAPPKIGPLRSSNDAKPGRVYFVFFANPGQLIQRRNPVTVTIGPFSVTGLVVK